MYRSCKCPVEQTACRCPSNESQYSTDDVYPDETSGAQCLCCSCDKSDKPMVRGKFGLAYVIETPKKKFCKPLGWQVEFEDTPSKIVNNCEKMLKWVNCPPLGDCNNIETNFCAYPDDCGQLLKERRSNQSKCCKCCNQKPPKKDEGRQCVRETKKKYKNLSCCNQNREPVCIICEKCRVNAPVCCNSPKVLCCSKTSRKPTCNCQERNDNRCKCCTKEESIEKYCCKCFRPKPNSAFFRESLDKKNCDQHQINQCCCAKTFFVCDDVLDYIPKKDITLMERNNKTLQDKQKDQNPPYKDRERSSSFEEEKHEQARSNARTYKIESKPVTKENKEIETEDVEVVRLKERKEKENESDEVDAHNNIKTEESINKVVTGVSSMKENAEKKITSIEPPEGDNSEVNSPIPQPKYIENEQVHKKDIFEHTTVEAIEEKVNPHNNTLQTDDVTISESKNLVNEDTKNKDNDKVSTEKDHEENKMVPKELFADNTLNVNYIIYQATIDTIELNSEGAKEKNVIPKKTSNDNSIENNSTLEADDTIPLETHIKEHNEINNVGDDGEKKSISKEQLKDDTLQQSIDQVQMEVHNNPGEISEEYESVQQISKVLTQPSILQKIREAKKKQLTKLHIYKIPIYKGNETRVDVIESTKSKSPDEIEAESEIQQIDYEGDKTILEKIKEVHQKQMHELHLHLRKE
nr:uncharacterized protein LOC111514047 isoform X1 [Leptinotarsa decemlineata]